MSTPTILRQTYHPNERPSAQQARLDRLIAAVRAERPYAVTVEVKRFARKHSDEQRGYLFGVCYEHMSEATGMEKEEIHAAMCRKHFGVTQFEIMGEIFERPTRTTTRNEHGERDPLDGIEYAKFIDHVIREAALWYEVVIPEPTTDQVPEWHRLHE